VTLRGRVQAVRRQAQTDAGSGIAKGAGAIPTRAFAVCSAGSRGISSERACAAPAPQHVFTRRQTLIFTASVVYLRTSSALIAANAASLSTLPQRRVAGGGRKCRRRWRGACNMPALRKRALFTLAPPLRNGKRDGRRRRRVPAGCTSTRFMRGVGIMRRGSPLRVPALSSRRAAQATRAVFAWAASALFAARFAVVATK